MLGVRYYSAKTVSHIAGLLGTCYGASQGKRPSPLQVKSYVENLIKDWKEIKDFSKQGYYLGTECVWAGKLLQGPSYP